MIRVMISGCCGHMGRVVSQLCLEDPQIQVVAGVDILGGGSQDYPVFSSPAQCEAQVDVVIDFSAPAALPALLEYALATRTPLVLATTGYNQEDLERIQDAARQVPLFRSANMSLGINVLLDLVRRAAAVLGESCDIEIIERHHHRKVDAPSGTALMIADAASSALPRPAEYVYDRHSVRKPRDPGEIGISAVRGGTIVGDHTVLFAGHDETIEISHHAASREIFAAGAVRAAKFLSQVQAPGLYDMASLLG